METLLVPIDVHGCAFDVCERAVWLARKLEAQVILLSCIEPPPSGVQAKAHVHLGSSETTVERMLDDESTAALEPFAKLVRNAGVPLEVAVRHGSPAVTILAVARELRPTLLVMGTHARTGIRRVVFGSVAEAVLRDAPCPVLVEPAGRGLAEHPSLATLQAEAEGEG